MAWRGTDQLRLPKIREVINIHAMQWTTIKVTASPRFTKLYCSLIKTRLPIPVTITEEDTAMDLETRGGFDWTLNKYLVIIKIIFIITITITTTIIIIIITGHFIL